MASLKVTESFYEALINDVVKEVEKTPGIGITSDALEYLLKVKGPLSREFLELEKQIKREQSLFSKHRLEGSQNIFLDIRLLFKQHNQFFQASLGSFGSESGSQGLLSRQGTNDKLWVPQQEIESYRSRQNQIDNKHLVKSALPYPPNNNESNQKTEQSSNNEKDTKKHEVKKEEFEDQDDEKSDDPFEEHEKEETKNDNKDNIAKSKQKSDPFEEEDNEEVEKEEDDEDGSEGDDFEYRPKTKSSKPKKEEQTGTIEDPMADDPNYRPLDEGDDDREEGQPDPTDILAGFHDKVSRNGTKWKIALKSCILNTKGKEYIFNPVNGDFEF